MPFNHLLEDMRDLDMDLSGYQMLDPITVMGQGRPQAQPQARALPQALARREMPQDDIYQHQLGLALMGSGVGGLSQAGGQVFKQALGRRAEQAAAEEAARKQAWEQQKHAEMMDYRERSLANRQPLVNVNMGGADQGWQPMGTQGQFQRTNPQTGMPEVMAAPGSESERSRFADDFLRGQVGETKFNRALQVAPQLLMEVDQLKDMLDAGAGGIAQGKLAQYGGQKPETLLGTLTTGAAAYAAGDALTAEKMLTSIKSNISIDQLQQMREASPTGGALGQVPVQQQEYLMTLLGGLDMTTPEMTSRSLTNIRNQYTKVLAEAMFGSNNELADAVRRNAMDPQTAAMFAQQRDEWLAQNTQHTGYDPAGRPDPGAPPAARLQRQQGFPQGGGAPPGWEAEWEYLTPEERARVLR